MSKPLGFESALSKQVRELYSAIMGRVPQATVVWDPHDWRDAPPWRISRRWGYYQLAWRQSCSKGARFELLWSHLPKRKATERQQSKARYREICEEYLLWLTRNPWTNLPSNALRIIAALVLISGVLVTIPAIGPSSLAYASLSVLGALLAHSAIGLVTPSTGMPSWVTRVLAITFLAFGVIAWLGMVGGLLTGPLLWCGTVGVAMAITTAFSQAQSSLERVRYRRWMRTHLDAALMGNLEAVFHHAELHKDSWLSSGYSRSVVHLLTGAADLIGAYLPHFLNAPKSSTIQLAAREISATFRLQAEAIHTMRGREDAVRLVLDSVYLVTSDRMLDLPRSKATIPTPPPARSRFTIRSAAAAVLPVGAIYLVKYFQLASGLYVDGLLALAALWAVVRIMIWIDPEFSTSLQAVASVRSLLSATHAGLDANESVGESKG